MRYPFMIGGEKRFSEDQLTVLNPYNGKEIGVISQAGADDVVEKWSHGLRFARRRGDAEVLRGSRASM